MNFLEKKFQLKENGTNVRTEIVAGMTTFFTMAYIIFVNPNILGQTGMPKGGIYVATILAAVIGTLIMGLVANVPYAQAPGMGLNAFFTFTVVFGLGYEWQQALAMVFICGIINIIITVTQIRKMIIKAIPESLQLAIGGGIGLFIAYIGFKSAGFLKFTSEGTSSSPFMDMIGTKADAATVVADGANVVPAFVNFAAPAAQLALIGLAITVVLMLLKVKGAMLIGIVTTTLIGIPMGVTSLSTSTPYNVSDITQTAFKLDFTGLFSDPRTIPIVLITILAFTLSDTFDTIGTFIGTGRKSGIFDDKDEAELFSGRGFKSKMDKALFADATATSIGALLGTSNTTTYTESAAGIGAGGRTGFTSIVTAIFFAACLLFAPVAGVIPAAATAPALIIVGVLMMGSFAKIRWEDFDEALPAFFTAVVMPFAYSISSGISTGFIFYVVVKICKGKAKEVHPIMYIVTGLFIINYVVSALFL
ncbi:AGZA family xanthine/uracil permease-like MFS transporter [Ruminiclostridium sufflavum DSM 19573]|uniref:AGZA family xanthine/uracil permease-like MFS transporter n=1 Tax=Ruminiclostridium sufflavum DSM 19573 TaxID=1121337 RepID=A0A318XFL9_9FIRM|nr:NCS2 family permease [Ruminiclostridium sufflavum]PYG84358.1 AGZA family xanthine/uracil permease-like MFS transporter [Ruminiclostridium sufflavum DSM 19573]